MKNNYASLFLGSAMLLSGASLAQSNAKGNSPTHGFETLRPTIGASAIRGGGPVNDDCSGATVQSLAIGSNVVINGDNTGGTDSEEFGAGSTWEAFTITDCANITVSYCGTTPVFGNFFLGLGANCPVVDVIGASGSSDCADGNLIITYEGVAAGTYYVPVLVEDGATGPYVMTISAGACATPPSNDECAGATSVTSAASCNAIDFTTAGATETMAGVDCAGFTSPVANDVWFSFVCTNAEQTIGVVGTNAADAVIELFSGACANLTSTACADATFPAAADETTVEQLTQGGLTVGTTYFFRVYDWGHGSADHNFSVCVTEGAGNNVGIAENGNLDATSIYPNPTTGSFNLSYSGADGIATIDVLDLAGRVVYNNQAQLTTGANYAVNLNNVAAGQYTLRLTVNGQRSVQSLMVK